jgi:solute carrier family 25, member 39/40
VPANIIYFTGYEWLRYNRQSPLSQLSDNYAPLVSGATARVFAAGAVNPIEMLRTRMQASVSTGGSHFAEAVKGITQMVSTQGYSTLWRGLTLTLWRDVPFSGIYWWGYENIRGALTEARLKSRGRSLDLDGSRTRARSRSQSRENQTATFTDSFIAGATSGAVASVLTMPFDVGKTRRQVFKDCTPPAGVVKVLAPEERSMMRFLWHIFREEGAAGLWRGWIPRTLKVAPACAIMISCYEVGKRAFRSMNEREARARSAV